MKKLLLSLFLSLSVVLISACSSKVSSSPISYVSSTNYSTKVMEKCIIDAINERNWIILEKSLNSIKTAYKKSDKVFLEVSINYTNNSYTINYLNSSGLKYKKGKISKKYVQWTTNLNKEIQLNLNNAKNL
ncbi:MAG: hypothetical protein ACI4V7_06815 [Succinivibrionaceae bacterium]